MDTRFLIGQKLTLEVTVTNREESKKLASWLYSEASGKPKDQMGCELSLIGFGHIYSQTQRLEKLMVSMADSVNLDQWLDSAELALQTDTEKYGVVVRGICRDCGESEKWYNYPISWVCVRCCKTHAKSSSETYEPNPAKGQELR